MTDRDEHPTDLGAVDLDGHTIEELSDYLDADRTPPNPSIENSPGCVLALESLERVRALAPGLLAPDDSPVPESWIAGILSGIAVDARAGRRVPLVEPAQSADLAITEGAIRGVIRSAEAAFPGLLIGHCALDGEVTEFGAPIRVSVDVAVPLGENIRTTADRLREEIARRLRTHTRLQVTAIDILVHDVAPTRTVANV